ncbi:MAG: tetratricopeptide repeat protein, partial [Candidatus Hodarchaeota archaeon]
SNIGEFYLFQRFDWKSHFDIKQKALLIFEELGIKSGIGECLARLSQHYWLKDGELGIALEYAEKALAAFEEVGDKKLLSWPHNNIGWIYQEKGEYATALAYFEKALEIAEEAGNKRDIIQSLWSITQIQQANGDDSAAMDNYKRCLELYEELGLWDLYGPLVLSWIYHQLILLALDSQAVDQAQAYFQQFSELKERTHSVWIDQRYLTAKAQLLKRSTRIKDKAKAQEIFQQIIDDESAYSALGIGKVPAMLNLCELLLFELRASSDAVTEADPVFQEAKALITNLSSIAKAMPSYSLLIDSLILQSKFALLEGDLSSAMEFLDQAGITAEEKKLTGYAQRVAEEQQQLESQFDTWQKLIRSNAPFQARLEQARMDDYLAKALKMAQTRQTL